MADVIKSVTERRSNNGYYNEMKRQQDDRSQFSSLEEFNDYLRGVRYYYASELNTTARVVLDVLAKHAAKYIGVCGIKRQTVADLTGYSISTVKRYMKKLRELKIISSITYLRPRKGGNGANQYIFNAAAVSVCCTTEPAPEPPQLNPRSSIAEHCGSKDGGTKPIHKASTSLKPFKNSKDLKERKAREPQVLDFTYARNDIPKEFIDAVKIRDYSAKAVNFAWDKVTLAFRKSDLVDRVVDLNAVLENEDTMQELIKRAKSAVRADKFNEITKDFGALLYGTMKQLFDEIADEYKAEERRAANVAPIYDWTNAAVTATSAEPEAADSSYTSVFNWSAIANEVG